MHTSQHTTPPAAETKTNTRRRKTNQTCIRKHTTCRRKKKHTQLAYEHKKTPEHETTKHTPQPKKEKHTPAYEAQYKMQPEWGRGVRIPTATKHHIQLKTNNNNNMHTYIRNSTHMRTKPQHICIRTPRPHAYDHTIYIVAETISTDTRNTIHLHTTKNQRAIEKKKR